MSTEDARFEDGGDRPLHLIARDADDLPVIAALVQDAVFPATEIRWQARQRRLALLVNRLRREDTAAARARTPERVQSLLVIADVLAVSSQGVSRDDPDTVLSLLSIAFTPDGAGGGDLELILAGDGAIRARVEALELTLRDVTRPYVAPSGKLPRHPD